MPDGPGTVLDPCPTPNHPSHQGHTHKHSTQAEEHYQAQPPSPHAGVIIFVIIFIIITGARYVSIQLWSDQMQGVIQYAIFIATLINLGVQFMTRATYPCTELLSRGRQHQRILDKHIMCLQCYKMADIMSHLLPSSSLLYFLNNKLK